MPSVETAARVLESFATRLNPSKLEQVVRYANLLMKWNRKINLTRVMEEESIYRVHFGESFQLWPFLEGPVVSLIDIGSGAGFPGMALKIMCPELDVTLLESSGKKIAFLGEVATVLGFHEGLHLVPQRLEDFAVGADARYDVATVRGVRLDKRGLSMISGILNDPGRVCIVTNPTQAEGLVLFSAAFSWSAPQALGASSGRVALVGEKRST
jgi:16S rRNA (guanine527-N7)-methyltransferase